MKWGREREREQWGDLCACACTLKWAQYCTWAWTSVYTTHKWECIVTFECVNICVCSLLADHNRGVQALWSPEGTAISLSTGRSKVVIWLFLTICERPLQRWLRSWRALQTRDPQSYQRHLVLWIGFLCRVVKSYWLPVLKGEKQTVLVF